MKKVLMIVGSLREQSFNRQLADKAAALIGNTAEVTYLSYADLPFMNQDLEFPTPDLLAAYPWLREELPLVNKKFKRLNSPLGRIMEKRPPSRKWASAPV